MIRIDRLGPGDDTRVFDAGALFDHRPDAEATADFLRRPDHYLFVAYDEGDTPVGFVTGVVLAHPDKGQEMFLYEFGVAESYRGRGYGRALVERLAATAREARCYGMWVLTDEENEAAIAAYEAAGGRRAAVQQMLSWEWGAIL
jgi:ribosomal protein S18 acetylase RimI-like enzyme